MRAPGTSHIIRIALLWLFACMPLPAIAQEMLATGQGEHGWAVLRATIGRQTSWTLYHLPRNAEPGTIARVRTLPTLPSHISTSGDRLLMVYEEPGKDGDAIRSVRQIRVRATQTPSRPRYEPATRAQVLPALPGWGTMQGFVALPNGAAALLHDASTDRLELFRLDASSWNPVALPDALSTQNVWGLVSTGGAPGVVGIERTTNLQQLWMLQNATDQHESAWAQPVPIDIDLPDMIVSGAGSSLVLLQRQSDDSIAASLHRSGRQVPLATLQGVGPGYVALNVADRVTLLWHEEDPDTPPGNDGIVRTHLHAAVFSPISGEILFEGNTQSQSLLTNHDLQKLTLLFGAVLVMILLFVLRPDPVAIGALQLPKDMAVTSGARRLIAGAIDLIPMAGLSAIIHSTSIFAALGVDMESEQLGLWPVLTTAALVCAMQTCSEWLFAATPGKFATGCRTVHAEGGKATFRQCLVRNLVKYACPPLAALLLLDPTRRHPGDYLAGTIVVMPRNDSAPEQDVPTDSDENEDSDTSDTPGDEDDPAM